MITRVGNGIFAIAALVFFTRFLNQEQYGIYAIGMAVVSLASGVFFNWLSTFYSRFFLELNEDLEKVFMVIGFGFVISTLLLGIIFLGIFYFTNFLKLNFFYHIILFILIILLGAHTLALQITNSLGHPMRYLTLSWIKASVALLIGMILVFFDLGSIGVLLGLLLGLALSLLTIFTIKVPHLSIINLDYSLVRRMFLYGLPLTLNFLAISVVDIADRFLIANQLSFTKVASYAAAYDLTQQLVGPIMHVLFMSTFPLIIKDIEGNTISKFKHIHDLGAKLLKVGLPICGVIISLATEISTLLFGEIYRDETSIIIPWLAAAIFLSCLKSYFFDLTFQISNKPKYIGFIAVTMAFFNIILNLILLPKFGVIAAAWVTFLTFLIGIVLSWFFGRKLFSLPSLSREWLITGSSSIFITIILIILPQAYTINWFIIKLGVGIIIYALVLKTIKWISNSIINE